MRPCLVLSGLALAACTGSHHVLDPAGPQSASIARLMVLLFIVAGVTYALVLAALALAVRSGSRRHSAGATADTSPETERRLGRAITVAACATAAVLLVYVGASAITGRALASLPAELAPGAIPLTIKVTGHQWWWEIEYADTAPSRRLVTANELHIPVGRPVKIEGQAADVIHSFWVPNLHGKRDLIPGRPITGWIQADTTGVWIGQCAEFCGHQHAKMRFVVIAEPPDSFEAWYARQLEPAQDPADSAARHGQRVFLGASCPMCHSIAGSSAGSRFGPDLTHLASRRRIAAGTLPNTRGHLAAWILNPQGIKPGVRMPPSRFEGAELDALLGYLETLR